MVFEFLHRCRPAATLGLASAMCTLFVGCDDGTFPCGDAGGSCDMATEICVVADGCSACVPLPEDCDAEVSCGCVPPASDPTFENYKCVDDGSCSVEDGGLRVSCSQADGWGCG